MDISKLKNKMPPSKQAEAEVDAWLEEYLNEPVAEAGFPNTAAALSAVLSAAGDLVIPDSVADAAVTLIPGGKLIKAGAKGMKKLVKSNPKPGKLPNYKERDAAEMAAKRAKLGEEGADTIVRDRVKGPKLIEGERTKRIKEMNRPKKSKELDPDSEWVDVEKDLFEVSK